MDHFDKLGRVLQVVGRAFHLEPALLVAPQRRNPRAHLARCFVLYLARVVYELPNTFLSRAFHWHFSAIGTATAAVEDYRLTKEFDDLLNRLERELINAQADDKEQRPRTGGADRNRDDTGRGVHPAE